MRGVYLMLLVTRLRGLEKELLGEIELICRSAHTQGLMTEPDFPRDLVRFYNEDVVLHSIRSMSNLPMIDVSNLPLVISQIVGVLAVLK